MQQLETHNIVIENAIFNPNVKSFLI